MFLDMAGRQVDGLDDDPRIMSRLRHQSGSNEMAGKIAAKNKTGGEMGATDAPAAEPEVNEARSSRLPRKRPALKVRHEPPTLDDAIYAAQGLTADIEQQIEFAADLMAMPATDLRPLLLKAVAKPSTSNRVFVPARSGMQRAVVIETTGRPRTRRPSSGAVSIP